MGYIVNGILVWFMILALHSVSFAGPTLSAAQKASLQAAMQQHIDRSQVNGAYLQLNTTTGEVDKIFPVTAHPMILRMGEFFVLCSDFRDQDNNSVNVDFYMARRGNSYIVFHTAVAERAQLERLMKAGKVVVVD